jgi:hypothetical protein
MVRFTLPPGLVTGTEVAAEGSSHELELYTNNDGSPSWTPSTVATANTTYSAPAMVRFTNKSGTGTDIAAEGPSHQLEFYYKYDNPGSVWHQSTPAGPNTTFSAPAMVRFSNSLGNGTEIAAEGPGHRLEYYYNYDGKRGWAQSTVAGPNTTYSPPAMVRFSNTSGNGTEIAAQGSGNQLDYYWNVDGMPPPWNQATVAGANTTYSAPAIVRFSNSLGNGTEIAAEGPGNQLDYYWNVDGTPPPWNQSAPAGPGTTYSAPAMVRFSNSSGNGTEIAAEGPGHRLEYYTNIDITPGWPLTTVRGPGTTYSAPAMVRFNNAVGIGSEITAQG